MDIFIIIFVFMETKEQLITNIKEWINMDTEINKLKSQLKDLQNKKKKVSQDLITVMKSNTIDCFDINGGSIMYKTNKVKKPINSKTLMSALQNYYKNDVKMAEELTKHIMENREEQVKEVIRRKIDK